MTTTMHRHLLVWGKEKIEILRNSHVVIAGVGGIGSVVADQLARSGVGALTLIDNGIVDIPDLGRQVLYTAADLDKTKVFVAAERLRITAPMLDVYAYCERVEDFGPRLAECLAETPASYYGFADCLDNYNGRFAFEKYVPQGCFMVHGGIEEERGQITTIVSGVSPSLHDIYAGVVQPSSPIPVIPQCCAVAGGFQALAVLNNLWMEAGLEVHRKSTLRGMLMMLDIAGGGVDYMNLA